MATAHQIRDLITQTTTGTARPRVPRAGAAYVNVHTAVPHRDLPVRHLPPPFLGGGAWTSRTLGVGSRSRENHDPGGIMLVRKPPSQWDQGRGK